MGRINSLSIGAAAMQHAQAADTARLGQLHGGVFENVSLGGGSRARAEWRGLKASVQGFFGRMAAASPFGGLKAKLTVAKDTVLNVVGRAKASFLAGVASLRQPRAEAQPHAPAAPAPARPQDYIEDYDPDTDEFFDMKAGSGAVMG